MAVRNTLGDMHNLLLEQMERLNDASVEDIDFEINRSKAMAEVATAVTNNAKTMVRSMEIAYKNGVHMPHMLTDGEQ